MLMLPSSKLKRLALSCNSSIAIRRSEQCFVLCCSIGMLCAIKATAQAHNGFFPQTIETINLLLITVKTFSRYFEYDDGSQQWRPLYSVCSVLNRLGDLSSCHEDVNTPSLSLNALGQNFQ